MDVSGLPQSSQDLLRNTSADRVIRKNMTPDDLAAIYKEGRGIKIIREDGHLFDHNREWKDASKAITKLLDVENRNSIHARLAELYRAGQHESREIQLLREKLSDLSRMKDTYRNFVEEARCQVEPNTLRH